LAQPEPYRVGRASTKRGHTGETGFPREADAAQALEAQGAPDPGFQVHLAANAVVQYENGCIWSKAPARSR
jgi:hypothetical protein